MHDTMLSNGVVAYHVHIHISNRIVV